MHQYSYAQDFLVFFKIMCDYIFAFQTETDRGFMVKIILIRVFSPFLPLLNETIIFNRKSNSGF